MANTYTLKIVSGVAIAGVVYGPGAIAPDVPEKLARELLGRGKAELATAEDVGLPDEPAPEPAPAKKPTKKPNAAEEAAE